MKVLIIKISSMGDIIHTLPAVTDALNIIPNISFDWIVEETFSDILRWHPAIHKIIPINFRKWKKKWYKLNSWIQYNECIQQFTKKEYDAVIDAQGLLKTSVLITFFARGKIHGMNCTSARESISSLFFHKRHYINKNQHAVERLRQLFSLSLEYSKPSHLGKYNINHLFPCKKYNIPYLIFFHASSNKNKHWPEFNWNIIIRYAINSGYYVKLPFWTKQEKLSVDRLKKPYGSCNQIITLPYLTLSNIAMQIVGAVAVISIDTGLSHLTAALNCPNLTLYGPTNPKLIGTYGKNQIILCSATKQMKHINPVNVWTTFQKALHHKHN